MRLGVPDRHCRCFQDAGSLGFGGKDCAHYTLHNCPGCLCLVDDDVAEDGTHDEHVAAMDEG